METKYVIIDQEGLPTALARYGAMLQDQQTIIEQGFEEPFFYDNQKQIANALDYPDLSFQPSSSEENENLFCHPKGWYTKKKHDASLYVPATRYN